ncbi:MAG: hypothetical protein F4Z87_04515, partial [Gammaproteobacteria bacterium]|nr:hypothetical protein [Gammaproteobacteria bacterium]
MIRLRIRPSTNTLVLIITGMILGVVATLSVWMLANLNSSNPVQHASNNYNESSSSVSPHSEDTLVSDVNNSSTDQLSSTVHQIDALEQVQSRFERKTALYELAAALSNPNIAELLTRSVDLRWKLSSETRDDLQSVLLERLSISNPKDASKFVLDRIQDGSGTGSMLVLLFRDWTSTNLAAAVEEAKKLPRSMRKFALEGILQAEKNRPLNEQRRHAASLNLEAFFVESYLASLKLEQVDDPGLVWETVMDIAKQGSSLVTQLGELGKHWYSKSGVEALDQMRASMKNAAVAENVFTIVLSYIATTEPDFAFDYVVKNLSRTRHSSVATEVIRVWATQNPVAAFEAVSNLDPNGVREQLRFTVIYYWAIQDPDYVLENLSDFPPQLRRHGAVTAIGTLTSDSPEHAVSRLLEIEDAYTKLEAAHALVSIWSRKDLDAAHRWVLEEPAISNISEYLYEPLVNRLVATDPAKALELARKHPLSQGQVGFEAEVLQAIAFQDMQVALDLLSNVRDGQRNFAHGAVGSVHIRNGDYQKAIDLGLE